MSIVNDFPTLVGEALGLSGSEASTVGGLVLTVGILASTAMAISAFGKVNQWVILTVILGELGLCTIFEWVTYWLMALAGIAIVLFFSFRIGKGI